jgi:ComF family protein
MTFVASRSGRSSILRMTKAEPARAFATQSQEISSSGRARRFSRRGKIGNDTHRPNGVEALVDSPFVGSLLVPLGATFMIGRTMRPSLRRAAALARTSGNVLVETVYPRRCAGCGRRGAWVCADCDAALPRFARPWCERCGAPPAYAPCRCDGLTIALATVRSAAMDEGWLREAIRGFKYAGESARGDHLGALLEPLIADLSPIDTLVPVPLHPKRERQRGFNQARLLARRAGGDLAVPVADVLVRTRWTGQQVGLTAEARRENVRGAFAVRPRQDVEGRRIVLIDDVLTTGSTLANCAETLVGAGASWVGAVTLAREA